MPMPRKREDEKLGRPNTAKQIVDKVEISGELTEVPEPGLDWSPIAVYAWHGWLKSPVRQFATETDVAFAWAACDALNVALESKAAMKIQAAESMMKSALFTEQARRNARIEVTRKLADPDQIVEDNIAEFRKRRSAG